MHNPACGSAYLRMPRRVLCMASVTDTIRSYAALYQRLLKAGKAKKVALTALMRKLLVHLNSLMRQQLAT
jgi:hypothetical protein